MESERWKRIETIFHAAADLPGDERCRYLNDVCGGDREMLAEVKDLLSTEDMSDPFLESSAPEIAVAGLPIESFSRSDNRSGSHYGDESILSRASGDTLTAGQELGDFLIRHKIGEGGMGEVYAAEDRTLGRSVAIKLLPRHEVNDDSSRIRLLREARAISILNHPNIVNVHSIERAGGRDFIVMELVDGETLKERAARGRMPLNESLDVALQVAAALNAAHTSGVVHRDLKPANILITTAGTVKIVDFGIAKRLEDAESDIEGALSRGDDHTDSGVIVGSSAYMSPEQVRGEKLDGRSDIFSLGSILYEILTGQRPFSGPNTYAVLAGVVNHDPPAPSLLRAEIPGDVDVLIGEMLAKDRSERFISAKVLMERIVEIRDRLEKLSEVPASNRRARMVMVALSGIVLLGIGAWYLSRLSEQQFDSTLQSIGALVSKQRYYEAYQLASTVSRRHSDEARLRKLMPTITDTISVSSEPPGASVYLRSFTATRTNMGEERVFLGTTPITNAEIARDDYLLDIEIAGYVPVTRSVSTALSRIENAVVGDPKIRREVALVERDGKQQMVFDAAAPVRIDQQLVKAGAAPERMVLVPGGEYRLVSYGRPTHEKSKLDPFFIDRFEVTNREFKEFVDAGGYQNQRFWKYPVKIRGIERPWNEAIKGFTDRTGHPAPRSWSNRTYPDGKEEYPVNDVSFYEAAAYAEFRGKRLPSIFQWEKAARDGRFTHTHLSIMPWGVLDPEVVDGRANLLSTGTIPVDSLEFGMSSFGTYNMAGNVSEWIVNQVADGYGVAGGSWKDTYYLFANFGTYPGTFAANTVGFRCVKNLGVGGQGAFAIDPSKEIPRYKLPASVESHAILRQYLYDKVDLESAVVEAVENENWRRETIEYRSGTEMVRAYLYMPSKVALPVQVISYIPSGAVRGGLTVIQEIETHAAPYLKAGRAVFSVILSGYQERRSPTASLPPISSIAFRQHIIDGAVDLQRGIDYLGTRKDIDLERLACMAVSVSNEKLALVAVEKRCRTLVLMGAGLIRSYANMARDANGLNFLTTIVTPKLMLHGRYDEVVPWTTEGEPLYRLLPPPKTLELLDQGHIPPLEDSVPTINAWLDRTLGPVAR